MDWTQVLAIFGANLVLIVGMLGTFIGVWLHQDKKLDQYRENADVDRREIVGLIRAIQEEMKDFHGRLERQDAEFKGRQEKADAEFKAHILHHHKGNL